MHEFDSTILCIYCTMYLDVRSYRTNEIAQTNVMHVLYVAAVWLGLVCEADAISWYDKSMGQLFII